MIKKVHLRLTLLCTAVTGAIVIAMTLLYLYVSESNMRENHYYAFQNDVNNILNGLQNQSVLSSYYLASLEAGGRYLIFIEDNGSPLLYGNIVENEERMELLNKVKEYYQSSYEIIPGSTVTSLSSYHLEFIYISHGTGLLCLCRLPPRGKRQPDRLHSGSCFILLSAAVQTADAVCHH